MLLSRSGTSFPRRQLRGSGPGRNLRHVATSSRSAAADRRRLDWSAALLPLCSAHVILSHARTRVIIFSTVCMSSGGSIELNPAVCLVTATFISYWKNKCNVFVMNQGYSEILQNNEKISTIRIWICPHHIYTIHTTHDHKATVSSCP